ncbi:hypothetical protein F0U60_47555 [Archangium minus]|uniref:DUF1648 domain-containing protein n=1 Tax=Archangium minus TaxID=83450 RepID=A0ABY9X6A9_9BACT|nr:hypothetical protein F0U60_47555 [Archangium minus]
MLLLAMVAWMPVTPQFPHPFYVVHDHQDGRSTTVSWRWRQMYPAIYFFVAIYAVFAIFIVSDSFSDGVLHDVLGGLSPLARMKRADLLPVMFFTGVSYVVAAWLLNRTFLEVDGSRLRIRYAPLPWPGGRTFRAAEVSGVLVKDRTYKDKNGFARSVYDLYVVLNARRRVRLLLGLPERRQAEFLEQRIVEGVLGIRS